MGAIASGVPVTAGAIPTVVGVAADAIGDGADVSGAVVMPPPQVRVISTTTDKDVKRVPTPSLCNHNFPSAISLLQDVTLQVGDSIYHPRFTCSTLDNVGDGCRPGREAGVQGARREVSSGIVMTSRRSLRLSECQMLWPDERTLAVQFEFACGFGPTSSATRPLKEPPHTTGSKTPASTSRFSQNSPSPQASLPVPFNELALRLTSVDSSNPDSVNSPGSVSPATQASKLLPSPNGPPVTGPGALTSGGGQRCQMDSTQSQGLPTDGIAS